MPGIAIQHMFKLCLILLRNPCPQVKFFFTAKCADDTKLFAIGTTGITSVASALLISGMLWARNGLNF